MRLEQISQRFYIRPRIIAAVGVGIIVAQLLPPTLQLSTRILCIWNAAIFSLLLMTWRMMNQATPQSMRHNAQRQDDGRVIISSLITAAACASLLAIFFMLKTTKQAPPFLIGLHLGLAIATIVTSWFMVHTIFALHYARAYYQKAPENPREGATAGLDFPDDRHPDYWDFLYYSFVIGMTSQVSDVQVTSRSMRRLTLLHGILSFFFNTAILATTINIAAGLL